MRKIILSVVLIFTVAGLLGFINEKYIAPFEADSNNNLTEAVNREKDKR